MASYQKFQSWTEYMCEGANVGSDQFVVALCAAANAPTNEMELIASLTQISYTNLSSRNLTTSVAIESGGEYRVLFSDLVLSASGGSVAAFRYIIIYDDTVASDPLVAYYDYGSDLTLANGESLTIDFTGNTFTVQ